MSELRFNLGPYSHIIIDIADEYFDDNGVQQRRESELVTTEATERAKQLQDWYDEAHPRDEVHTDTIPEQPYEGPAGDPGPEDDGHVVMSLAEYGRPRQPQQRERAPQQEQPRYGAGSGVETREQMLGRSWGDCPECGDATKPSIEKYQEFEDTEDGISVPAKHYCNNARCALKGKTIWRRQLVFPEGA